MRSIPLGPVFVCVLAAGVFCTAVCVGHRDHGLEDIRDRGCLGLLPARDHRLQQPRLGERRAPAHPRLDGISGVARQSGFAVRTDRRARV